MLKLFGKINFLSKYNIYKYIIMSRPKGSKNKPKVEKVIEVKPIIVKIEYGIFEIEI